MAGNSSVQIAAWRWVDSLEPKWRLQILSQRYRMDEKTGKRVALPTRIRRFVEGMPAALADEAMKYLLSKAPYKGIVYNGVEISGEYRPTLTTWKRDDSDVVNGRGQTDGTYTLVQDLVDASLLDRYGATSSLSCTEEVQTDWVWDAGSIEGLPATGDLQGVTYSIQSVSRSEEGTFSYSLVKRVAKTQHTPRVKTKVTRTEIVETESWDNLYGEPMDFTGSPDGEYGLPVTGAGVVVLIDGRKRRTEVQVSKNPDCTYRVQATYVTSLSDALSATEGGSCGEIVEYEHHWNDDDLDDVDSPSQGRTVSIQGLARNDDGTYSYVVVTRTAVTQDSGWVVQSETSTTTVRTRTWNNVYGVPDNEASDMGWTRQNTWVSPNETNSTEIPPASQSYGVLVEVQVAKNEDCTYRVTVTETTTHAKSSADDSTHTQFEGDHTEQRVGSALPLGTAPDASGGVIKSYESQLQPDGSYRTVEKTKVERPVPESVVQVSVGRKGRRTTRVDTNQSLPARPSEIAVGGSVKVEKTPGRRYTNTVTTWDKSDPVLAGESCTKNIFQHQHSETKSGVDMPSDEDHVVDAAGGKIVDRRTDMDDEGAVTQTVTTTQERFVENSKQTWRVGLTGMVTTVEHRNVSGSDTAHMSKVPSFDRKKVGTTLEREKTPGGLYNVTVTAVSRDEDDLETGAECSKTAFQHDHSGTTSRSDGSIEIDHVADAGGGKYYTSSARLNDDGSSTIVETTHEEISEQNASVSFTRTAKGLKTTVTDRNQQLASARPEPVIPPAMSRLVPAEDKVGSNVTLEMTNGKLYNVTATKLDASSKPDHALCQKTVFQHTTEKTKMGTGKVDEACVVAAGVTNGHGTYYKKVSDLDDMGFVRTVNTTVEETPVATASKQVSVDHFRVSTKTTDRNQLNAKAVDAVKTALSADPAGEVTVSAVMSKNDGGSFDVVVEKVKPEHRAWDETFDTNWKYKYIVHFVNATDKQRSDLYSKGLEKFQNVCPPAIAPSSAKGTSADQLSADGRGENMPSSYDISPSVNLNSYGLFDGSYTFTATWPQESAGQSGTADVIFHMWSYTERTISASASASGSGSASMTQIITDRHVFCASGRGTQQLDALITESAPLYSGTRMTFDPVTQLWNITLVNSCVITITGQGS